MYRPRPRSIAARRRERRSGRDEHLARGLQSAQQPERGQSQANAEQAKKSQLSVAELQQLLKGAAPPARHQKWQQALDDEDQRQRLPKRAAVQKLAGGQRRGGLGGVCAPEPRMARKNSDEGSSTITSERLLKLDL